MPPSVKDVHLTRPAKPSIYTNEQSTPTVSCCEIAPTEPVSPVAPPETTAPCFDETETRLDTDQLIALITSAAETLIPILTDPDPDVQSGLSAWADYHGWAEIDSDVRTTIARQAILVCYARAALYEHYHVHGDLPPLSDPARTAFEKARKTTGHAAFEKTPLDDIVWRTDTDALARVLSARVQLLESTHPAADLAKLHDAILPPECRQYLGQFRTPEVVGDLLRTWAVDGGETVLDSGIGAGVLSHPFRPRWDLTTDPDYIVGIDRSPLARVLSTVALTLYDQAADIQRTDFFDVDPDAVEGVDAIIANPPYTAADALDTEYVSRINTQIEQWSNIDVGTDAPLYVYFVMHATQFLREGGKCALLVPTSWLQSDYGEEFKRFLLTYYRVEGLLTTSSGEFINEADVDTVALFLRRAKDSDTRESTSVNFCRATVPIEELYGSHDLPDLYAVVADYEADTSPEDLNIRHSQQAQENLTTTPEWSYRLRAPETYEKIASNLTAELQDLADVRLGLTTGCNSFFHLSADERTQHNLDATYTDPLLKSSKDCETYTLSPDDLNQYVFTVDEEKAALEGTPAGAYIAVGEERDIPSRAYFSAKSASDWFKLQTKTAPLVHPTKIDKRHFACRVPSDICVDKNFLRITPDRGQSDFIFAWLNSTLGIFLKELAWGTPGGGCLDGKVGTTRTLPILKPDELTDEQMRQLSARASTLATRSIEDVLSIIGTADPSAVTLDSVSSPHREIDRLLMEDVIGLSRTEQRMIYRRVIELITDRVD